MKHTDHKTAINDETRVYINQLKCKYLMCNQKLEEANRTKQNKMTTEKLKENR